MLTNLRSRVQSIYLSIISSIAFYPALLSIFFFLLSLVMLSLETSEITNFLIDRANFLVISDADTARSILGTLIGGILSLMVFSFSMVMILLNQASSNFSPRLLPGLISDKSNQLVLGIYLGTIIYNIIVLISIVSDSDKYTINGLSILIGIVLGVVCLVMFVYFIHSISIGIQINNILDKIYTQATDRLKDLIEEQEENKIEASYTLGNYNTFICSKAIYYQGLDVEGILTAMFQLKVNVRLAPFKGKYVLPNTVIFTYDKELTDEEVQRLNGYIIYSNSHQAADNYVLRIKQITEVGVKAMSPGINDPGTAVMTVDYLTEILALRMQLNDREIHSKGESEYVIELNTVNFGDLLYQMLAAYRQYCKHDIILMEKLILMLKYLLSQPAFDEDYYGHISEQLEIIKQDYTANIENETDRNMLDMLVEKDMFNNRKKKEHS